MAPSDNASLKEKIIKALAASHLDYPEQIAFLEDKRRQGEKWRSASVLLILQLRKETAETDAGGCHFLLNKRSLNVQQPGDLCCPGGGSHPLIDHLLSYPLSFGFLNPFKGPAYEEARKRGSKVFRKITYFFTTTLRESWEEIRLNPFLLDFLGPLPCYRLNSFHRTIFPMVAMMERDWSFKPNWEVEDIVRLPLESFFDPENYGIYSLYVPENLREVIGKEIWEFPCFLAKDGYQREVLWGATYQIVMSFLDIVFGFKAPDPGQVALIKGSLSPDYFICRGPSK